MFSVAKNLSSKVFRPQRTQSSQRGGIYVGKHIANAFKEELSTERANNQVVAKFATTATDGNIYQMEYFCVRISHAENAEKRHQIGWFMRVLP